VEIIHPQSAYPVVWDTIFWALPAMLVLKVGAYNALILPHALSATLAIIFPLPHVSNVRIP
jgi:hypothetical protein